MGIEISVNGNRININDSNQLGLNEKQVVKDTVINGNYVGDLRVSSGVTIVINGDFSGDIVGNCTIQCKNKMQGDIVGNCNFR